MNSISDMVQLDASGNLDLGKDLTVNGTLSAVAVKVTSQIGYSAVAASSPTTPSSDGLSEYDCSNPATSGTFKLTASCTLAQEVVLTGDLTLIGQTEDMNNLVTITAAANSRHFKLENTGDKLNIWHLKLTGGDVSSYTTSPDRDGGSISMTSGTLNLYYSEISGNEAGFHGGGIYATNGNMNIYGSIIRNNHNNNDGYGGGIYTKGGLVATIEDTIIDNNQASDDGGAIFISGSCCCNSH